MVRSGGHAVECIAYRIEVWCTSVNSEVKGCEGDYVLMVMP